MLTLPVAIVPIFAPFAMLFTDPTWQKAQLLLVGAILATGQRTVAAALRVMGPRQPRRLRPLPRGAQSGGVVAPRGGPDPALAAAPTPGSWRRSAGLRHRRNPGAASGREDQRPGYLPRRGALQSPPAGQVQSASGGRWVSLMWLGHVPWAGRYWALPVLTVLARSSRYYQRQGRRHKKITDWARQMVMSASGGRRWLPYRPNVLVGETATQCWTCSTAPSLSVNPLP